MGLFDKIKKGLQKTRDAFSEKIEDLVMSYRELDDDFFEELTDILIMSDVGVKTTELIIDRLKQKVRTDKIKGTDSAREAIKQIVAEIMESEPIALPSPTVLLVVGVNGVGKTTSIGKMAARFKADGKKVIICAGDTFRAAAADQLTIWADRAGVPIIKQHEGADPAAVVYDGVQAAKSRGADVLIVDTAGRLHNKAHLMEELKKINRVINREYPNADVKALLVIDATTGQNGLNQALMFRETAQLDGIILTKLDGTAKGGIALAIRNEMGLPVRFIGVGEKIDDLQPFDAMEFAEAIF
ncbi:MAG: signal recognition particle-docking protein FtsY [Clostridia bacterium]|nr:signal recognition particle-docking protein FtsY [Clostridia bacterium]